MTNWYFRLPRDVVFSPEDRGRIIHKRAYEEYSRVLNEVLFARLRGEAVCYPYFTDFTDAATKEFEEAIRLHKIVDEEYMLGEVLKTRYSTEKEKDLLDEFGPEVLP